MKMNKIPRTLLALAAAGSLAAGCGPSQSPEQNIPNNELAAAACAPKNALPVPRGERVQQMVDGRFGKIFACMYLNDLNITPGKPIKLREFSTESYADVTTRIEGKTSGMTIIGTGKVSGYVEGSGSTQLKQATVVEYMKPDRTLQTLAIDNDIVVRELCPGACEPELTVEVSNEPVWEKGKDDKSSIWIYQHEFGFSCHVDDELKARRKFIAKVALQGHDETCNPVGDMVHEPQFDMGPLSPSEVISHISERIVISLPNDQV
jgi:hypothetical protein